MTDSLKPGRELDALIAEKVMGIRVEKDQVTRGTFADSLPDDPSDFFQGATNDRIPAYSTDIASAWEVVEKFDQFSIKNTDGPTEAHLMKQDPAEGILLCFHATGETAAHAICLAALKVTARA